MDWALILPRLSQAAATASMVLLREGKSITSWTPRLQSTIQVAKKAHQEIQHKELWGPQDPPPSKFFM